MKSYIKIYGPPFMKAIQALEKVAISVPEVCIMDPFIELVTPKTVDDVTEYFTQIGEVPMSKQRCGKIISKSGEKVGEYDFYFDWFKDPSLAELNELIEKIDNALAPLGCKYTITTKMR